MASRGSLPLFLCGDCSEAGRGYWWYLCLLGTVSQFLNLPEQGRIQKPCWAGVKSPGYKNIPLYPNSIPLLIKNMYTPLSLSLQASAVLGAGVHSLSCFVAGELQDGGPAVALAGCTEEVADRYPPC